MDEKAEKALQTWKEYNQEKPRGCRPTLYDLLIFSFIFVIVMIFIGFAILNFLKFKGRSCASEVKVNLASIYVAQVEYFRDNGFYATHDGEKGCLEILDWKPKCMSKRTLYSYYCDSDVYHNRKGDKNCPVPDVPPVTATSFTIYAVGNIDDDPECDVWTINDAKQLMNVVCDP